MMPAPFDYRTMAQDPVAALQSGMAFGQQQRAGEQQMQLAQSQDARAQEAFGMQKADWQQQQADRAAAMEAQMAMNADMAGLADKFAAGAVAYDDIAALTAKYPDMADQLGGMWEGLSTERKAADTAELVRGIIALKSGRPDLAIKMLEDRATAAENGGDQQEADTARALAESIKASPEAGIASLSLLLQVADPEAAKAVFGGGRSVQSTNAYANGMTVTVFSDGTKEVTDAAGTVITGPDAIAAVEAGMASEADQRGANSAAAEGGKLQTQADLGTAAEAAKEAGKVAVTASKEAYDSLQKVRKNISNVQTAIDALDAGAEAGAIQKYFPDITTASASLSNAMNQLGLDVIGSVTFGALSEGEMKLAMETAVPRNLDGPQLKQWLVAKKSAQEKAAAALREAAIYLGKPGNTLATYLEEQGITAPEGDQGSQGSGGGQTADDILKEIEGL